MKTYKTRCFCGEEVEMPCSFLIGGVAMLLAGALLLTLFAMIFNSLL